MFRRALPYYYRVLISRIFDDAKEVCSAGTGKCSFGNVFVPRVFLLDLTYMRYKQEPAKILIIVGTPRRGLTNLRNSIGGSLMPAQCSLCPQMFDTILGRAPVS